MTKPAAKAEKVRLKALQVCQLGGIHQRLVQPGEVFEWDEPVLPPAHIAAKVPSNTPLGMPPPDPREVISRPNDLPWTTQGHVQKATRQMALAELL